MLNLHNFSECDRGVVSLPISSPKEIPRSYIMKIYSANDNGKTNDYFSLVHSPAGRHLIRHLHLIAVDHQVVLHQVLGSYYFIHKHVI